MTFHCSFILVLDLHSRTCSSNMPTCFRVSFANLFFISGFVTRMVLHFLLEYRGTMSLSAELLFHVLVVRVALNLIRASVLSEVFEGWKFTLWDFLDPYLHIRKDAPQMSYL